SQFIPIATRSPSWILPSCADLQNVCQGEKQLCSIPPAVEWPGPSVRSLKYDLSVQVAQRLLDAIENQPRTFSGSTPGPEIIASGTSCRHQIADLTSVRPKHMAELLAEAIVLPS